jgi:uncharacterized integral membrane protein
LFPLAVVLIVFAVSNRDAVLVDLWPLPTSFEIPLFILLFAALVIGVFWGGVATWLSGGSARKAARIRAREAKRAETEIRHLKDQISKLEADVRAGDERAAAVQVSGALAPPKEQPGLLPPASGL